MSDEDNNAYLITDTATGQQLLVDAADSPAALIDLVSRTGGGGLTGIVTTHRHWDHHRALADLAKVTNAPILAGAADADDLPLRVDRRLAHGDSLALGEHTIAVIGLRGHTPGSIALAIPTAAHTILLTGDSLFPGGVGKTNSPSDFDTLLSDIKIRLFETYPGSTVVHPGHGDGTTLGAERLHLEQWRARGW